MVANGAVDDAIVKLNDLRANFPDDSALGELVGALTLSRRALVADTTQLLPQLLSRLSDSSTPGIVALLAELDRNQVAPWLSPVTRSHRPGPGPRMTLPWMGRTAFALMIPASGTIVTAGRPDELFLWDLDLPARGRLVDRLRFDGAKIEAVSGHPSTSRVAVELGRPDQRSFAVVETAGKRLRCLLDRRSSAVRAYLVPRGFAAVVCSLSGEQAELWDVESGNVAPLPDSEAYKQPVAYSATEKQILVAASDGVHLVDYSSVVDVKRLDMSLPGDESTTAADVITPFFGLRGPMALLTSYRAPAILWDFTDRRVLARYDQFTGFDSVSASLLDGRYVAFAASDYTVRIIDTTDASMVVLAGHECWVSAVADGPEPGQVATASRDGTVGVWDIATSRQLHSLRLTTDSAYVLIHDPARGLLFSRSSTSFGLPNLWSTDHLDEEREQIGHGDCVSRLALDVTETNCGLPGLCSRRRQPGLPLEP